MDGSEGAAGAQLQPLGTEGPPTHALPMFVVEGVGFEPTKGNPLVLQTSAIGRSATPGLFLIIT